LRVSIGHNRECTRENRQSPHGRCHPGARRRLAAPARGQVGEADGARLAGPETSARLRLGEALALAEARNPMLRAMRSGAVAARAREPEASTLPDPMLEIGVMNFGVPSFDADMPTSMAPSIQLTQMVPFPGKLGLRGDIAAYSTSLAETDGT
jgi:hypothetical protein